MGVDRCIEADALPCRAAPRLSRALTPVSKEPTGRKGRTASSLQCECRASIGCVELMEAADNQRKRQEATYSVRIYLLEFKPTGK
jgi:hypothetical protein